MPEFLACADFLAAVAVQLGQKICQRPLNTGRTDKLSSKPYSGYTVGSASYVHRNNFGQVDLSMDIEAGTLQNTWHTIAYVPEGFRPTDYRRLVAFIILGTDERKSIPCYVYSNGEIKVTNYLATGSYTIYIYGSYFV